MPRLLPTLLLAVSASASAQSWVGTWATAPVAVPNTKAAYAAGATLHQTVHLSLGGDSFRITVTNELGTGPLILTTASIAPANTTTTTPLTFGGQPGIIIPPGALAVSDPVALHAAALSDVVITMTLPAQKMDVLTLHPFANTTNTRSVADQPESEKFYSFDFLKSVDVSAPGGSAIVAFGDSITDGALSTRDAHHDWPADLAARLHANKATAHIAVLNEGIGGNRILHDGAGPNALARFDRDVLSQSGVHSVILLEGINDIGAPVSNGGKDFVTADQLIVAMKQLILRAHAHGLRILGATLTPYLGAGYASPQGEDIREAVNAFIRKPGSFDGVVDFDKATEDPANPNHFAPSADSGDHLHPKDAGYKTMSDAIDLKLLAR